MQETTNKTVPRQHKCVLSLKIEKKKTVMNRTGGSFGNDTTLDMNVAQGRVLA